MNPWFANMIPKSIFIFAVTTWCTTVAITITIDRADVKTLQPHNSMTLNGWRPVTTRYEEIGVNVSPATNLERNAAPLHPVLNKLQEHMASSERLKPQRKVNSQDYNPPSILGSFTVFGHAAAKARGEGSSSDKKYITKETKEYSFLIPPPRDTLRFEIDPHKKPILRETDPYIRQSQFLPQMHKPDMRNPSYYIKSPIYSTTVHPMLAAKNRPPSNGYNSNPAFLPQLQTAKPAAFESLKVGPASNKKYLQMTKSELQQAVQQSEHNYERYTPQSHITTVNGNFFNQVSSHAPQNYKTTFERDPSFLVHESHEVGYVTPPFEYKFRHPVPFESLIRPDLYPSTNAPRTDANKYVQPVNNYRNEQMKPLEPKRNNPAYSTENAVHPTYYVAEAHRDYIQPPPPAAWQMKQQYKPDINEVLPKANPPNHFNQPHQPPPHQPPPHQPSPHQSPPQQQQQPPPQPPHQPVHRQQPPQSEKVVYIRPELQQQKQFQGSIIPININQKPQQVDFETPESISLKHFNEQQFLLQQQLIEQDRRRLQEHEMMRQKQLDKKQQEEIISKQEELRLLERQQQTNAEQQDLKKEVPKRKQNHDVVKQSAKVNNHRYTSERNKPKQEKDTRQEVKVQSTPAPQPQQTPQSYYEAPTVSTEPTFHYTENTYTNQPAQRYESGYQNNDYYTTLSDGIQIDSEIRRPQPDPRDPSRKKKPSYDKLTVTELPTFSPEIEPFTEIPIQTTTWEPFSTTPAVEKLRTRKPSVNQSPTPRRRRPSSTTAEPEVVPTIVYKTEDFYKYDKQEADLTKRQRRPKPQPSSDIPSPTEARKPARKRPNHRNNPPTISESYSEVTSDINPSTFNSKTYDNYDRNVKNDTVITEFTPTYTQTSSLNYPPEFVTEIIGTEYPNIQAGKLTKFEYYEPTSHDGQAGQFDLHQNDGNLPLEHLFVRTEPNFYETTTSTTPSPTENLQNNITPTRTTIKISKSQEISKATITTSSSSTTPQPASTSSKPHHRVRPLRYGNATRPRFSVKEYKTRMDLKNKIAQSSSTSSTEQPIRKRPAGQRTTQQPFTGEQNLRESTGRYKYMSRVSYKTSTTTPSSFDSEKENSSVAPTEKTKFTPKRRLNANLYRSRFSAAKQSNADGASIQNANRPETMYTSSRRRVSGSKAVDKEKKSAVTEMAAEETSFYSQPTTSQYTESVNEIMIDKEINNGVVNQKDNETNEDKNTENVEETSPSSTTQLNLQVNEEATTVVSSANVEESVNSDVASATPFNAQLDEELFAKASQSVADLTSSASALYNKPGLFKAVSSGQDNRKSKNKLQITTEEATLPIEAFFQELSKKVD